MVSLLPSARLLCSMATPIRWPASIRAWICRNITDEVSFANSRSRDEGRGLPGLPGAGQRTGVERFTRAVGSKSGRRDYALHWQVDAHLSTDYPGRDSVAQTERLALAGAVPPHAGLVRVLLRHSTPDDLRLAGQILRPPRHVARYCQAKVYHRRHDRLVSHLASGSHIDRRMDPPPGRKAVAAVAPADLFQRHGRGHPLHMAGQ